MDNEDRLTKEIELMSEEELRELTKEEMIRWRVLEGRRARGWHEVWRNRGVPAVLGVYVAFDAVGGRTERAMYVGSGVLKVWVWQWLKKGMYVKWRVARKFGEEKMVAARLVKRLEPPLNQPGLYKLRRKPLALGVTKNQAEKIVNTPLPSPPKVKKVHVPAPIVEKSGPSVDDIEGFMGRGRELARMLEEGEKNGDTD
jgi:hypothetical protein